MYLYPENLTARPMLWLWTLRDVAFIGVGLLLSVLALTQAGTVVPLVVTAALAFLCIRHLQQNSNRHQPLPAGKRHPHSGAEWIPHQIVGLSSGSSRA